MGTWDVAHCPTGGAYLAGSLFFETGYVSQSDFLCFDLCKRNDAASRRQLLVAGAFYGSSIRSSRKVDFSRWGLGQRGHVLGAKGTPDKFGCCVGKIAGLYGPCAGERAFDRYPGIARVPLVPLRLSRRRLPCLRPENFVPCLCAERLFLIVILFNGLVPPRWPKVAARLYVHFLG